MSILVLNAGSSTLKFSLYDDSAGDQLASGIMTLRGGGQATAMRWNCGGIEQTYSEADIADYGDAVGWILRLLKSSGHDEPIQAVGHRVVHGGTEFRQATLIDEHVRESLQRLSRLAPLHNPLALTTIEAAQAMIPRAAQVAVFDTSFFADLPMRAFLYPLPYEWYEQYGIRRFGFHGISHACCAVRAAELLQRQDDSSLRLVICHLGNGCSATAVHGGRPVATTMGFTPLDGLMMGTRSGSVDPGILMHLIEHEGFTAAQLDDDLNRQSGLLGVSGISSDFRQVEQAAVAGNERANLAIEMFADRIRSTVGSLAVTLGGIDGLVFTAGIGEGSAALRSRVCRGLECLGLQLDEGKNEANQSDSEIATEQSSGRILVLQTREETAIARVAIPFLSRSIGDADT